MKELEVTIAGQPFDHLFYHFTLTCSNWETGTICFGESFESLAQGLQNPLWELGAVSHEHRTDNLSAAIIRVGKRDELTAPYRGLLAHYGLRASHNSPGRAHENGDVEQSHYRFKRAALSLRGTRDFATIKFPDLGSYRIPKNPKGLGSDDERERVLESEEIAAISEHLAGPPPKTWPYPESWRDAGDFFLIALATGIRIGDILELKWDDLNKHFATLKVKMQKVGDKELLLPLTKTVELVVARRKAEGLGSATRIFTLRDHSIRDAFRNASKEASIPYGQQVEGGWTVHDLRRTYLTGLLQSGVDLATVRDLAGHHSITVTSRYVRSTPSSRRNAVTAAENLVRFASTLQVNRGQKGNRRTERAARKGNETQ